MHTDHRTAQSVSDLRDGEGGSVGCENALRLRDLIQLRESGLLYAHILESSLNDQIAVRAEIFLHTRCDLCENRVHCLLGHLSLGNQSRVALGDLVLSALGPLLLD